MWLVTVFDRHGTAVSRHMLVSGVTYTVGRRGADVLLPDGDASISRHHVTLSPMPTPADSLDDPTYRPPLLMADGSKHGTLINGVRVARDAGQNPLGEADVVTCGRHVQLKFGYVPVVAVASPASLTAAALRRTRETVMRLGGLFSSTRVFDYDWLVANGVSPIVRVFVTDSLGTAATIPDRLAGHAASDLSFRRGASGHLRLSASTSPRLGSPVAGHPPSGLAPPAFFSTGKAGPRIAKGDAELIAVDGETIDDATGALVPVVDAAESVAAGLDAAAAEAARQVADAISLLTPTDADEAAGVDAAMTVAALGEHYSIVTPEYLPAVLAVAREIETHAASGAEGGACSGLVDGGFAELPHPRRFDAPRCALLAAAPYRRPQAALHPPGAFSIDATPPPRGAMRTLRLAFFDPTMGHALRTLVEAEGGAVDTTITAVKTVLWASQNPPHGSGSAAEAASRSVSLSTSMTAGSAAAGPASPALPLRGLVADSWAHGAGVLFVAPRGCLARLRGAADRFLATDGPRRRQKRLVALAEHLEVAAAGGMPPRASSADDFGVGAATVLDAAVAALLARGCCVVSTEALLRGFYSGDVGAALDRKAPPGVERLPSGLRSTSMTSRGGGGGGARSGGLGTPHRGHSVSTTATANEAARHRGLMAPTADDDGPAGAAPVRLSVAASTGVLWRDPRHAAAADEAMAKSEMERQDSRRAASPVAGGDGSHCQSIRTPGDAGPPGGFPDETAVMHSAMDGGASDCSTDTAATEEPPSPARFMPGEVDPSMTAEAQDKILHRHRQAAARETPQRLRDASLCATALAPSTQASVGKGGGGKAKAAPSQKPVQEAPAMELYRKFTGFQAARSHFGEDFNAPADGSLAMADDKAVADAAYSAAVHAVNRTRTSQPVDFTDAGLTRRTAAAAAVIDVRRAESQEAAATAARGGVRRISPVPVPRHGEAVRTATLARPSIAGSPRRPAAAPTAAGLRNSVDTRVMELIGSFTNGPLPGIENEIAGLATRLGVPVGGSKTPRATVVHTHRGAHPASGASTPRSASGGVSLVAVVSSRALTVIQQSLLATSSRRLAAFKANLAQALAAAGQGNFVITGDSSLGIGAARELRQALPAAIGGAAARQQHAGRGVHRRGMPLAVSAAAGAGGSSAAGVSLESGLVIDSQSAVSAARSRSASVASSGGGFGASIGPLIESVAIGGGNTTVMTDVVAAGGTVDGSIGGERARTPLRVAPATAQAAAAVARRVAAVQELCGRIGVHCGVSPTEMPETAPARGAMVPPARSRGGTPLRTGGPGAGKSVGPASPARRPASPARRAATPTTPRAAAAAVGRSSPIGRGAAGATPVRARTPVGLVRSHAGSGIRPNTSAVPASGRPGSPSRLAPSTPRRTAATPTAPQRAISPMRRVATKASDVATAGSTPRSTPVQRPIDPPRLGEGVAPMTPRGTPRAPPSVSAARPMSPARTGAAQRAAATPMAFGAGTPRRVRDGAAASPVRAASPAAGRHRIAAAETPGKASVFRAALRGAGALPVASYGTPQRHSHQMSYV